MKIKKKPVIFLLGPTAAGKTDWAISWQKEWSNLEIISVDSVMVYKECNIGSAKPSPNTLKNHPHHLINCVSLNSVFSVADFCTLASRLIDEIHQRNKIPLLVGGSMMYFNLLKKGISDLPSANDLLRKSLEVRINEDGIERLHEELTELDPVAAAEIQSTDTQRIIRAIEVVTSSGMSLHNNIAASASNPLTNKFELIEYGIFPENRAELHQRIKERQVSLVGGALLDEIQGIQDSYNLSAEHPAMKAINYRQGLQVINGELKQEELFEKSLFATRQFAKRQCTWMRGWDNLNNFDLHELNAASERLKKQLNLLEII